MSYIKGGSFNMALACAYGEPVGSLSAFGPKTDNL